MAAFVVASSLRSSFFGRRSSGMPPADPAPEAPVAASLRRPPPPLPPLPPPAPISSSFSSSCFCFDDRYSVASCASSAEFLKVTTVRRCSPWPTLTVVRPGKYSWTVLWIRNRRREFTAGNRSAQLRRGPRGRRCVNNLSTGSVYSSSALLLCPPPAPPSKKPRGGGIGRVGLFVLGGRIRLAFG